MASVPGLGAIPRRLAVDAFWNLFGRLEHEQLDFKRGVPDDVRDTIAAMAMTHGGLIVHGVDDRRNVVGCPLSQNTQDRITRIAFECGVDVQVREVVVGERKLTICAVPAVRGRIVTTPDGRLLRRVGGDAQPLRGDALAWFVSERQPRCGPPPRQHFRGGGRQPHRRVAGRDARPVERTRAGRSRAARGPDPGAAVPPGVTARRSASRAFSAFAALFLPVVSVRHFAGDRAGSRPSPRCSCRLSVRHSP